MKKLLTVSTLLFLDLFIVTQFERDNAKWMFAALGLASLVWLLKELIRPMSVPLSSRFISEGAGWMIALVSLFAIKLLGNSVYQGIYFGSSLTRMYMGVSCGLCFSFMVMGFSIRLSTLKGREWMNILAAIVLFIIFLLSFFFTLFTWLLLAFDTHWTY